MRTDVSVAGKPALAVVLSDIAHLTYSIPKIQKAITVGNYGQTAISKDFLLPGEECVVVRRGPLSKRRRCETMYNESIDTETWKKLLQSKYISQLIRIGSTIPQC